MLTVPQRNDLEFFVQNKYGISLGASSSAVSPQDIPGMLAAWVADDIGIGNGAAVSSWVDRVAGFNLAQSTGANQPLYRTTGVGGQPAVDFDGTDDSLIYTAPDPVSVAHSGHVFAVVVLDTLASFGTVWSSEDTSSDSRILGEASAKAVFIEDRGTGFGFIGVNGHTSLSIATPYLIEWASDGSAYELRVNGVVQTLTFTSGTNTGYWFDVTTSRDNFVAGEQGANFINGKIAALFVVGEAPGGWGVGMVRMGAN